MKKLGILSIGSGIALLILCELPWLFGFTALATNLSELSHGFLWAFIAVGTILIGIALWLFWRQSKKSTNT